MRLFRRKRAFFEDDGGFSTAGMVLALLVTLSLLFCSAQVYRVQSAAADIQNVADAAALAADNQVASFYIVAQVCDAAALSMGLTATVVAGAGIVALCIPFFEAGGAKMLDASRSIFQARSKFVKRAAEGLERLQKLLPFIAAAQSYAVVNANGNDIVTYFGFAVLLPVEGEPVNAGVPVAADEVLDDANEHKDAIEEAARKAEEAAREANEHKQRAFMADCGNYANGEGRCMYERASVLSSLAGAENPLYDSVEAWSFGVAMRRAKAYYPQRLAHEAPLNSSVTEMTNSVLRARFYTYACDAIARGYVNDDPAGAFAASFPLLPCNTEEMKATSLYTEEVYPITVNETGEKTMHAWAGCPEAQAGEYQGIGSVQEGEDESFVRCEACDFSAASVGKIAAASTSIDNGFEHYYRIVADEARAYQEVRERQAAESEEAKKPVKRLLDRLKELVDAAGKSRIEVHPPGRYGAIAIVADTDGVPVSGLAPTSFVSGGGTLGTRAAISAATLVDDESSETENVISSLLDGVMQDQTGSGWGCASLILDIWSSVLSAYAKGTESVIDAVESAIDRLPLASQSGLGAWAANALRDALSTVGLQPAKLSAGKPVIVNTYHVASADSTDFSQTLIKVKTAYAQMPGTGTGDPLSAAIDALGDVALEQADAGEQRLLVAVVDLLGGEGTGASLEIALPPAVKQTTASIIESAIARMHEVASSLTGVRIWQ